jgi:hypothetical protein
VADPSIQEDEPSDFLDLEHLERGSAELFPATRSRDRLTQQCHRAYRGRLRRIEAGDAVEWLIGLGGQWEAEHQLLDLAAGDPFSMHALNDFLRRYSTAETGSFLVQNNGLCLLLAFCLDEMRNLARPTEDDEPGLAP